MSQHYRVVTASTPEQLAEAVETYWQIELTNGVATIVDPEDYGRFSMLNWCVGHRQDGKFCAKRKVDGKTVFMHREIMSAPADMVVDHINGNPLDNRKANLRVCLGDCR